MSTWLEVNSSCQVRFKIGPDQTQESINLFFLRILSLHR